MACLILIIYCVLGPKWDKIFIIPSFWLKFHDVTTTLSLIVLSPNFFHKLILILSYCMPNFVEIKSHLHGQENRSTLHNLQNSYRFVVLASI